MMRHSNNGEAGSKDLPIYSGRLPASISRLQFLILGILLGSLPGLMVGVTPFFGEVVDTTTHTQPDCVHVADSEDAKEHKSSPSRPIPTKHAQWCPKADCTDTDLCHPCQRRFLIVIATPRSASTTLTWMLDELPGIRMAGENNNLLSSLMDAKNTVYGHPSFHKGHEKKTSWGHNYIPNQTFACAAQAMMESINPPKLVKQNTRIKDPHNEARTIVGFKTIRFERGSDGQAALEDQLLEKIEFVKDNFPCARVILNMNSNVTRQAKSIKEANWGETSERSLLAKNTKLQQIRDILGPQQAFLLDSAEWTQDVELLNEAVKWLGFNSTTCRFRELLSYNTVGDHGFSASKKKLTHKLKDCKRI